MTRHAHLDPRGFTLAGGSTGILLLHGYTGAPTEMRLVGDYLNARGLTVSAPLLPGHGTTVEDLNTRTWPEWTAAAEVGLSWLTARCQKVFVAGLSMGALLALYTVAHHPEVAGVIAYSPAVLVNNWRIHLSPVAKYFIASIPKGTKTDLHDPDAPQRLWSYELEPAAAAHELFKLGRQVQRLLPAVHCPLLVVYSTADHTIHRRAGPYTYARAGSAAKQLLVLHDSGHVITVDREWEQVASHTYQFIRQYA
ncbi:MAG TPA: alpha/beta fold hydrolase [Anaerolineae bacterium]